MILSTQGMSFAYICLLICIVKASSFSFRESLNMPSLGVYADLGDGIVVRNLDDDLSARELLQNIGRRKYDRETLVKRVFTQREMRQEIKKMKAGTTAVKRSKSLKETVDVMASFLGRIEDLPPPYGVQFWVLEHEFRTEIGKKAKELNMIGSSREHGPGEEYGRVARMFNDAFQEMYWAHRNEDDRQKKRKSPSSKGHHGVERDVLDSTIERAGLEGSKGRPKRKKSKGSRIKRRNWRNSPWKKA